MEGNRRLDSQRFQFLLFLVFASATGQSRRFTRIVTANFLNAVVREQTRRLVVVVDYAAATSSLSPNHDRREGYQTTCALKAVKGHGVVVIVVTSSVVLSLLPRNEAKVCWK